MFCFCIAWTGVKVVIGDCLDLLEHTGFAANFVAFGLEFSRVEGSPGRIGKGGL